jgi:hypothetical protein
MVRTGLGRDLAETRDRGQARPVGQVEVKHEDVGLVRADETHRVIDAARLGDDLAVRLGFEQASQAAAHDRVIVGQDHADLLGTHADTVVGPLARRVRGVPRGRCGFARMSVVGRAECEVAVAAGDDRAHPAVDARCQLGVEMHLLERQRATALHRAVGVNDGSAIAAATRSASVRGGDRYAVGMTADATAPERTGHP